MATDKKEKKKLKGVKFVTPPFRLSFPHLFEPHKAPQAKDPKYSITMLFPKDSEERKLMNTKLRLAAAECWGKDKEKWPKIHWPWRDGDDKAEYKGYAGHDYASADTKADSPPGVVNRQREDILNPRDIYAGCYARAEVTAKAIPGIGVDDNGKPKNFVKFYLSHVMFWQKGEAFGAGGSAKDAFAEIADEADESDDSGDDNGSDGEDFDFGDL